MTRAPFQIHVIPFHFPEPGEIRYALLRREPSTGGYWQGIAGGGEDDETPLEAARREALEEAGIGSDAAWIALDTMSMIPVVEVAGFLWGDDVLVIPNYCFGVGVDRPSLTLSQEHTEYSWLTYEEARERLRWDDNRDALWELDLRLHRRLGPNIGTKGP